jgi:hypothetical protein
VATRFFNRAVSRDDALSRILFYSVLAHYVIFYLLFGNPFLLQFRRGGEASTDRKLDVELLSPGQINIGGGTPIAEEVNFPAFPPEAISDEKEEPASPEQEEPVPLSEEGMKTVDQVAPAPPAPKKVVRKLPRNMTGPEDCLLKVVAMVCPEGDSQCIAEYQDFCLNLPD